MLHQGLGRGLGIPPAGPNGHQVIIGFNHIPLPGYDQDFTLVRYHQPGLEPPQNPVGAPLLGQLDSRPLQLAGMFLQLAFKPLKKGYRIGNRTGETGDYLVVEQGPDLLRRLFEDNIADRDLAIPRHGDLAVTPDRQNRCSLDHLTSLSIAMAANMMPK